MKLYHIKSSKTGKKKLIARAWYAEGLLVKWEMEKPEKFVKHEAYHHAVARLTAQIPLATQEENVKYFCFDDHIHVNAPKVPSQKSNSELSNKISVWKAQFKAFFGENPTDTKQDLELLRTLEVDEKRLKIYFSETNFPFSELKNIKDYKRNYSAILAKLRGKSTPEEQKKYGHQPSNYDERQIKDVYELQAYRRYWRTQGWAKLAQENSNTRRWVKVGTAEHKAAQHKGIHPKAQEHINRIYEPVE